MKKKNDLDDYLVVVRPSIYVLIKFFSQERVVPSHHHRHISCQTSTTGHRSMVDRPPVVSVGTVMNSRP